MRSVATPFRDDSGRDHAGVLTGADLAAWQATYEDAVTVKVGDWTLAKGGAWSQGPTLAQQVLLLNSFVDELAYVDGVPTARTVHLAVECAKLAFADREAWFGDVPDVPLAELLSADYIAERAKLVGDQASWDLRPGSPGGREPRLPDFVNKGLGVGSGAGEGAVGEPTVERSGRIRGDTVHLDVVDAHGNIVSATPSGGWLQSSPTIPELGFCLGSRAQMFWLEEGLPNSLAPGKRPRTTLSPSMAVRDGGTVAGVRHAGRRPAGPVAAVFLVGAHRRRPEPAGSDRRAGLAHHGVPEFVLPEGVAARRGRRGVAAGRGEPGRTANSAAMPWWTRVRGTSAGCPPCPGSRPPVSCAPAPTRGRCRVTRWVGRKTLLAMFHGKHPTCFARVPFSPIPNACRTGPVPGRYGPREL